jgi:two-component system sensor histidine kinase DegS
VVVSDDGGGFDTERPDPGFGLVGMRERAELVDGRLVIDSTHGKGTVIRAVLPAVYESGESSPGAKAS